MGTSILDGYDPHAHPRCQRDLFALQPCAILARRFRFPETWTGFPSPGSRAAG
jgi:hypothetical protein